MKTQLIASWKQVNNGVRDMYIINTIDGEVIWVNKSSFDTNAEQVTFRVMKAGDEYTTKDGVVEKLKADRNEFLGCGKQVVKKFNSMEILDHLVAKGITPTFAMS